MNWDEQAMHYAVCIVLLACAPITAIALLTGAKAPYGRYAGEIALGPTVPGRVDWYFHSTSLLALARAVQRAGPHVSNPANVILMCCFGGHYCYRSFVFPNLLQAPKPCSLVLLGMTSGFCLLNGWLQSRALCAYDDLGSALHPRFLLGVALFAVGWYTNVTSDLALTRLRKPGESGYKIPRGGLFEYVSGANFLGEIIEWTGFSLAAGGTLASATFAVFTLCNIGPRAVAHHANYRERFGALYPRQRRALIPFVW